MTKYSFQDFEKGDSVYHLSNPQLRMVVISKDETMQEVTCRWVDKSGAKQVSEYLPEELGKTDDLRPRYTYATMLP